MIRVLLIFALLCCVAADFRDFAHDAETIETLRQQVAFYMEACR